ncbi:MAG: HAMP domain-containing histidine kinase [Desulfobulbaceae bacterium]|nr:HAMP domain-containing histidine kinase [Desulfobulbaceae bacterium]
MPLLAALYSSVQILDAVVQQSVATVFSSVDRVKRSRAVVELFQDQERMARLYDVLGEPVQLQYVNKAHLEIEKALEALLPSGGNEQLGQLIGELKSRENYIITVLNRFTTGPEKLKKEKQAVLSQYREIGRLAASLLQLSNQLMVEEVEELRLKVDQDKDRLIWQTSGLIFFTILFSAIFILLIFRPIRQIDKGIESLGEGNFETPITVSGPRDLENLGTKLDWLRKRLAKLDREKVKLIAHISHDLKTPLASIKEGAGLLQDELVGPINDQQKQVVGILAKNCSKLQRLIEDILNFNMAQARQMPLANELIQLDTLIEDVVADHRNSILARNIKLDVQLVSVAIYGNRNQLKTVFDNLISNAVKFTPDHGVIRILLKADSKIAACLVEDSGGGVDEEERSQIFSPFFQGKKAEKSVVKGSGLGLAISKEYVQNHGGTIRLLPGKKGARFAVTLPLKE